ncbi:MAG: DUF4276 family protein [candidate division WS1 bacterium]|nr:DUF4276 family protein [candidate division WS1 bacterium]
MHIEIITEEPSAEAALMNLLRRMLPAEASFAIRPFRNKDELLGRLPQRLRGYAHWLPEDWRVVVLVDRDADDCHQLKARLDVMAADAGLTPKARAMGGQFDVLNRIAIEELEAWFFGDVSALRAAYSHVPETLAEKAPYRDPDAIRGGTWEALAHVLGCSRETYPKIAVAREVSRHMDPERNRSRSFQAFRAGIADLVAGDA